MSTLKIGILAEDATDCKALKVLVQRLAKEVRHSPIDPKPYSGKGCARLRQKAAPMLKLMFNDGCSAAILVHDLDRNPHNGQLNHEQALRTQLETIETPQGLNRLICIPIEEIEAWFWADPAIIREIGRGKGDAHPSPHLIDRPKERLIKLSIGANKKPRYTTNDNKALAEKLNLHLCAERCPAFRQLKDFVHRIAEARHDNDARLS